MTLVLIRPGNRSNKLKLQAVLRERHGELAAAVERRIKAREAAGASDAVDWVVVAGAVDDARAAVASKGGKALLKALRAAADAAAEVPEPLGAYVDGDGYDDVDVVFVALRDARRQELLRDVAIAEVSRVAAAKLDGDAARFSAVVDADVAVDDAKRVFLKEAVANLWVGGEEVKVDDEGLDAVAATGGLLADLFVAARDYQGLSPGKGMRFGSPPPRT